MAESDDQKLGLDASDYLAEAQRVIDINTAAEGKIEGFLTALNEMAQGLDDVKIKFSLISQGGDAFNATLAQSEEGFQAAAKSIRLANSALTQTPNPKAEEHLSVILDLTRQESDAIAATNQEQERRNQILADQKLQYERIKAEAALLERAEANRLSLLERMQTELARVEQQETAQAFGAATSQRFITNAPGFGTATAADVNKVATSIAQIQNLINQEAISVQRAEEIMASVQARTGEVFAGTEGRVAAAAIRINETSAALATSYNRNAQRLEASNERLTRSFNDAGEEGEHAGRRILLSWETMGRLLIVQQLHNVVYQLVNALKAGTDAAEQFEIRISEIRTIAANNQLSFETWARSVEDLSNQFGNPILDVAEGAYETLSNQVAKGADAFTFVSKALQFSQTTLATTKDSVNLLSAALNSFHISLDQVDRVASVFFNTIDLGRVRAEDLANIFGRVAPLAHSLGVSFEETNAAIATLTINGVPANEAMTLINNVLTHLLNPTKEMKVLFQQLGVSSGEAAIATFGFAGVLDRIEKASNGSATEIGQLFRDIRAIRGALDLTGPALQGFKTNLEAIRDVKPFDLATKISVESAGKQFQIQMNEIKNFFINDFGVPFIHGIVEIGHATDSFGLTTHGLVDIVKGLVSALTVASGTFIAYIGISRTVGVVEAAVAAATAEEASALVAMSAAGTIASATMTGLTRVLSGLTGVLSSPTFLLTALAGNLIFLYNESAKAADEATRQINTFDETIKKDTEEATKAFRRGIDAQTVILQDNLDKRFQAYLDNSAKVNRALNVFAENEKEAFKEIAAAVKASFEVATKEIQDDLQRVSAQAKTAQSEIESAQRSIDETIAGIKKTQFESSLKLLPESEQIDATFKHINDLAAQSNKLLTAKTGDADEAKRNREEAAKLTNASQTEGAALIDKEVKAREKIKDLAQQITELETRQAARGGIQQDVTALNEAKELERQYADAKKKHHDAEAQQLRINIELLQKTARGARDTETDRAEAAHIDQLKKQKAEQEAILEAVKQHGDLTKALVGFQDQYVKGLEQYQKTQQKILDTNKALEIQDRTRLADLRVTLEALEKVKAPATVKDSAGAAKFLAESFDVPLQKAIESGAIRSEEVVRNLLKERAILETQLNLQVQQEDQRARDAALIAQKEKIKGIINTEQEGVKTANNLRKSGLEGVDKIIVGSKDTPSTLSQLIKGNSGLGLINDQPIKDAQAAFLKQFQGFQEGKVTQQQVQVSIGDLESAVVLALKKFSAAGANEVVPGSGATTTARASQSEVEALFNQLSKSVFDITLGGKELNKANQEVAKNQALLSGLGVTPEVQAAELQKQSKDYTQSLSDAVINIQKLNHAVNDLSLRLSDVPVAKFAVSNGATDPSTSTVTQTNNFDFTINSTEKVTPETLQQSINEAVRRGQLKIPSPTR